MDNSMRLWNGVRPMPRGIITREGTIEVVYPPVNAEPEDRWRAILKRHVKTALLIRRAYDYWRAMRIDGHNVDIGGVYLPENEAWTEAWTISEHYLAELQRAVAVNGGTLYLVPIPEYLQLSSTWEQDLKAYARLDALPDGFVRERPQRKIEAIARTHHIPMIDLFQGISRLSRSIQLACSDILLSLQWALESVRALYRSQCHCEGLSSARHSVQGHAVV
jgi:hypothetical protein